MVNVIALLKKDYTEEEIYKIADQVNTWVNKEFNIYDVGILKTTDKAVYHENKDVMMKVPKEYIKAHMSVEGLELSKEEREVFNTMDNEAIRRFVSSDKGQKLYAEYTDITIKYYAENGNSVDHKIEPNKYALIAKSNFGALDIFEDILKKCKIDVTDIIVWENAEFGFDAFEKIAPKSE